VFNAFLEGGRPSGFLNKGSNESLWGTVRQTATLWFYESNRPFAKKSPGRLPLRLGPADNMGKKVGWEKQHRRP